MELGKVSYDALISLRIQTDPTQHDLLDDCLGSRNRHYDEMSSIIYEGNFPTMYLHHDDRKNDKVIATHRNIQSPAVVESVKGELEAILSFNKKHIDNIEEYEVFLSLPIVKKFEYYCKKYLAIKKPHGRDMIIDYRAP